MGNDYFPCNDIDIEPVLVKIDTRKKKSISTWTIKTMITRSNFRQLLNNRQSNSKQRNDNNNGFWNFLKSKRIPLDLKLITYLLQDKELVRDLSYDEITAIYLYNSIQTKMNKSINDQKDEWSIFCGPFLSGLTKLAFQYDDSRTTYRWISTKQQSVYNIILHYKAGDLLRFDTFLSTYSQVPPVGDCSSGFMLEITNGFRGRDISQFGKYKPKTQILFNITDHFEITNMYEQSKIIYVQCIHIPIPINNKTILWVDDKPNNNKYLMKEYENNGIMIIPQISTNGAIKYLDIISKLIDSNIFNELRIITDMHRFEYINDNKLKQKTVDILAGITLIKQLKKRGYQNRVCIFTSQKWR
eukprot:107918_1